MLRIAPACLLFAAVVSALLLSGCGRGERRTEEPYSPRIAARLYGRYISSHKGVPPRNAEELKAFVHKMSADELKGLGVDAANLDKNFESPRDGKPLVFRDPARFGGMPGPQTVVLYEAEGTGGKRQVVYSTGQTEEVDPARFKQLVPEAL